jgi:hypothetical protein
MNDLEEKIKTATTKKYRHIYLLRDDDTYTDLRLQLYFRLRSLNNEILFKILYSIDIYKLSIKKDKDNWIKYASIDQIDINKYKNLSFRGLCLICIEMVLENNLIYYEEDKQYLCISPLFSEYDINVY